MIEAYAEAVWPDDPTLHARMTVDWESHHQLIASAPYIDARTIVDPATYWRCLLSPLRKRYRRANRFSSTRFAYPESATTFASLGPAR